MAFFPRMKSRLSAETLSILEWGGSFLAIAIMLWWYHDPPLRFVPHSLFALLAVIPSVLGLSNHFLSVLPRYRARRDAVEQYQRFCEGFDEWWRTTGWPRKLRATGFEKQLQDGGDFARVNQQPFSADDLLSYRPMTAAALWSALLLVTVFMVAASVADDSSHLLGKFPELQGQTEVSNPAGTVSTSSVRGVVNRRALNGLLFAALGAFVSVMWRMINRVNANALTSRFMSTCALRSAIAMMIGLVAAQFDLLGFLKSDGAKESIFFLVGLFTDWALSSLRTRARTVFNQPDTACDRLPLCYVDGLDDGVIDILDEIGIWDVEHLATTEPGELTIRTLLPFNRVIDWIDQAILIAYVRRNIIVARQFGVGGAIDLALTYSYTLTNDAGELTTNANNVLNEIARKSELSRDVLNVMCRTLWLDYTVEQLYRFWQHHHQPSNAG